MGLNKKRRGFRVWDNENNKYFENTYEAFNGKLEILEMGMDGSLSLRTIDSVIHESIFPDRFIVEHETGKTDKNGLMIHDGDITNKGVIRWSTGMGCCADDCTDETYGYKVFEGSWGVGLMDSMVDIEIIGNIHQNPELLEEQ